jgi:catalase
MRVDDNFGSTIGYEPNSKDEWQEQANYSEPPLNLSGAATHWDHREDDDYYSQPGNLFRLMSLEQKEALFNNTAGAVGGASIEVQKRHIGNCLKADLAYGTGVAKALGIEL